MTLTFNGDIIIPERTMLDTFVASFIDGMTTTTWFLCALVAVAYVFAAAKNDDDDDDDSDGGTLQPVYQGSDE